MTDTHAGVQHDALLCDFGMANVVGDITDTPAMTTLTKSGSSRWLAPELIFDDVAVLTRACDVWSFGMTILELFTMHHPWAECKRDSHVIRAMENSVPARPRDRPELTNEVWAVALECWNRAPGDRPAMSALVSRLQ